jgi:hypothetical protein
VISVSLFVLSVILFVSDCLCQVSLAFLLCDCLSRCNAFPNNAIVVVMVVVFLAFAVVVAVAVVFVFVVVSQSLSSMLLLWLLLLLLVLLFLFCILGLLHYGCCY